MNYNMVLNFTSREASQLWIEDVFDTSAVQILSILPSAFRGQMVAQVHLSYVEPYIKAAFESGLNDMSNSYPKEARKLAWWQRDGE